MKRILIASVLTAAGVASGFSQAKYVFYFIGDGMGMGHVNTTETYNRDILKNEKPLLMMQFPIASQVRTFSANNKITDSAAAGTALSTGFKTNNSMIGMGPDTTDVTSVAKVLLDKGYGVGIASTVAGDDATPAAFYAHAPERGMKYVIAPQAAASGYHFLSAPMWRGMKDKEGKNNDWVDVMKKNGYTVFNGYESFTPTSKGTVAKTLLLSANPQGEQTGYTIDSIPGILTAKQITEAAVAQLEAVSPKKFFLMMEGGNIDWAAHSNDGGAVVKEILNYQEAIDVAYQFYLKHPKETLIVVTADHDTGGLSFGRYETQKGGNLGLIDFQKISKDRFSNYLREMHKKGENMNWEQMQAFLKENLGFWGPVRIKESDEKKLKELYNQMESQKGGEVKTLYNTFYAFVVKVYDIFNREAGIGWTSDNHTANFVPLYAIGKGSELFQGSINNIDIPKLILKATGN